MSQGSDAAPRPISLVVATVAGWPGYEAMFRVQRDAIRAVGGELIIADGSGLPGPPTDELGQDVTWISLPGLGVFELRSRVYHLAVGQIVAITEDHCVPGPAFAARIAAVHAEHPEAGVIGGVVENGATNGAWDWGLFFVSHFRDMPSVGTAVQVPLAGITIATYKRRIADQLPNLAARGLNEAAHQRALAASGEVLLIDDRIRVTHVQSRSPQGVISITRHAARTAGAMRRTNLSRLGVVRLAATPIAPFLFVALMLKEQARRNYARAAFIRALPVAFLLLCVRAVADAQGVLTGPGDSANRFP